MIKTKYGTIQIQDANGIDWTNDFIGNLNGLVDFEEDGDMYTCTKERFDFWSKIISDASKLYNFLESVKDINYGMEEVFQEFWQNNSFECTDFERQFVDMKELIINTMQDGEVLKSLDINQEEAEEIYSLCKGG